ncbi:hypothetical protein EVAR_2593_1 [Eumeta japonica]|uniref:Uncharacterized protein n=1 Tax=Eumeta variegata TaxID=151549 RepID=A0A4C1SP78_EUMVA|nr:hypothetical protein EVAR_2593_1 [Eumeta japonica]
MRNRGNGRGQWATETLTHQDEMQLRCNYFKYEFCESAVSELQCWPIFVLPPSRPRHGSTAPTLSCSYRTDKGPATSHPLISSRHSLLFAGEKCAGPEGLTYTRSRALNSWGSVRRRCAAAADGYVGR